MLQTATRCYPRHVANCTSCAVLVKKHTAWIRSTVRYLGGI